MRKAKIKFQKNLNVVIASFLTIPKGVRPNGIYLLYIYFGFLF